MDTGSKTNPKTGGWNRPSAAPKSVPKKPSALRGLLGGLLVVALIGIAFFAAQSSFDSSDESGKARPRAPIAAKKTVKPSGSRTTPKAVAREVVQDGGAAGDEVANKPAEQVDEQKTVVVKRPDDGIRGTDQLLGMAMSLSEGKSIPPMPIGASATRDFKESLKTPIVINDDDPEEVKETKRMLMDLREQLRERVENGEKVENILREHQDLANDNIKIRNDIVREVKKIREEGDEEGARKYLNTMNVAIQQMGIEMVDMPLTDAEQKELDEQETETEQAK